MSLERCLLIVILSDVHEDIQASHLVLPRTCCSVFCLTTYVFAFRRDFLGGFSRVFSTWDSKGAKVCRSCRSRKMLQNEYLVAKIGFDTAENRPFKVSMKWGSQAGVAPVMSRLAPRFGPFQVFKLLANFRGLVNGCIEADFRNQILIRQRFSRSTRFKNLCTAPNSNFRKIFKSNFQFFLHLFSEKTFNFR